MSSPDTNARHFAIYNDKRKLATITVSYLLLAATITVLAAMSGLGVWPIAAAAVIDVVFALAITSNLRRMADDQPLFVLTSEGVTDYTKKDDVISLPWSQILSVTLKAANSNDLVLDVMGYKTVDQLDTITPQMRARLDQTGGDRVYYLLELSGLWVRQSRIREAFGWMQKNAQNPNPELVFSDFEDPLSKLGGKDGAANPLMSGKRRLRRFGKRTAK